MKFKNIPEISSSYFTFHKDIGDGMFSTEASDLVAAQFMGPKRIYDDAADHGFYLVSEKTGDKLLFVEEAELRSSEDEITGWVYSAHCIGENPEEHHKLKLTIFND